MKRKNAAVLCRVIVPLFLVAATVQSASAGTVSAAQPSAATVSSAVSTLWKPRPSGSSFSGYTPAQVKTAYGIGSISGTGKGQTIALVECYGDPNLQSDLSVFSKKFSLPAASLIIQKVGAQKSADDESSWASETALDVEWAHAMAPDAALLVVEAENESTASMLAAADQATASGAKVVSMSWGWQESNGDLTADSHFTKNGVAYVAAAGDSGAGSMWPASSPNVIAVGGTTLMLSASGTRLAEAGWEGSGGGESRLESLPSWQEAIDLFAADPFAMMRRTSAQASRRLTPDVSFDADPSTGVAVYCSAVSGTSGSKNQSGWYTVGGTSLGAPCWAGIIADLDSAGLTVTGASSLYAASGGTNGLDSSSAFYDIIGGSNGYFATEGYDLVTGLGSPAGDKLEAALKSPSSSASTQVTSTTTTGAALPFRTATPIRRVRR